MLSQHSQHEWRGDQDQGTELMAISGVLQQLSEVLCKVLGGVMPEIRRRRVSEAVTIGGVVVSESIRVDLTTMHRACRVDAVIKLADVLESGPVGGEDPRGRAVRDEDPHDGNASG